MASGEYPSIRKVKSHGSAKLEDFADLLDPPPPIIAASVSGCYVEGDTGALLNGDFRLITELSPYSKCSPIPSPWDHPSFLKIRTFDHEQLKGESVLLSNPNASVYFHWMLEIFPRLSILERCSFLPKNYRCLVPAGGAFIADSLRSAGIPESRILTLNSGTRYHCESLLTTSGLFPQANATETANWLKKIFLESPSRLPETTGNALIYISRKDSGLRTVENESEIIGEIEKRGGKVLMLEGMTISEQARHFHGASCIVAPHGSALTNLVFCRPGTKIIELFSPSYVRVLYPRIGMALDLDYSVIIGQGVREASGKPALYAPIRIQRDLLSETLDRVLSGSET